MWSLSIKVDLQPNKILNEIKNEESENLRED